MPISYQEWLGNRPNNTSMLEAYRRYVAYSNNNSSGSSKKLHLGGYGVASPTSKHYDNPGYVYPDPNNPSTGAYSGGSNDTSAMTDYWAQQYSSDGSDYYKKALESAKEKKRAQIEAAVGRLNAQRPGIYNTAEKAAAQNYASKEKQRVELPQILAATGKSGGLTDSAALEMNTTYENNRNDILSQRDEAINNLDLSIADVEAGGDADIADIENQYAMMQAQEAQARQDKLDSLNQQLMLQYYKNQGSGTKSVNKPRLTQAQAKSLYDDGYTTDEVMSAMAYYAGADTSKYGKTKVALSATEETPITWGTSTGQTTGSGGTASPSMAQSALRNYRNSGMTLNQWLSQPAVYQSLLDANLLNWFKNYAPR